MILTLTPKDPAGRVTVNIRLSPVEDLCRGEPETRLRRDLRVSDLVAALDSAAKQVLRAVRNFGFYTAHILMKLQPASAEQLRSESKLTPPQLEELLVHLQKCHVLDVIGPECTFAPRGDITVCEAVCRGITHELGMTQAQTRVQWPPTLRLLSTARGQRDGPARLMLPQTKGPTRVGVNEARSRWPAGLSHPLKSMRPAFLDGPGDYSHSPIRTAALVSCQTLGGKGSESVIAVSIATAVPVATKQDEGNSACQYFPTSI
ncbi:MAG: hypothetical protein ABJD97_05020 [Betaproteobacteria bacterium]